MSPSNARGPTGIAPIALRIPETAMGTMSKINRTVLITLPFFMLAIAFATWQLVSYGQQRTLEYQAIELAEIIARQAASARSVYTRHVVGKLKQDGFGAHIESQDRPGFVPLPAQFLKLFGEQSSRESDGLFSYQPLSKWNLEPTQGLDDDFKRWAWAELEKQDRAEPDGPIDWQPVWRFETVDGITTLKYLRADPAAAESCVACHNAQEAQPEIVARRIEAGLEPGKQWHLHQLLGAIQVNIPMQKVVTLAARHTNLTTLVIISIFGVGLLVIAYFIVRDLMRTQQAAAEMTYRANHDDLTGLASRHAFEQRAQQLLARAHEDDSRHALMFLDLDQFKVVNDTCGHIAGDELLCEIAETMSRNVRSSDMLARLGGDEFGVLLEGCDIENAYDRAEKLRKAIRDIRFTQGNRRFEVGVSIGLVAVDNDSEDVTAVMSLADLACYTAKDEGRNRIKVYSDTDTLVNVRHEEMDWASRFNRAIEEGRLKLAIQHSASLTTDVAGNRYSEILLRMVDADGEPVPTAAFVSAAERYHFMPSIDRWVVGSVLSMIQNRQLKLDTDEIIAINLSGISINETDFLGYVQDEFTRNPKVSPTRICFEITETAAIGNISSAQTFITELRRLGCKFALDDFGSGLSSLAYLKNLSIDFLKIEGSFVRDMLDDPLDQVVVEAVSLIGKRANIATIAEWVENDALLEAVKAMGIDFAQGFGIHKPEIIDLPTGEAELQPVLLRREA